MQVDPTSTVGTFALALAALLSLAARIWTKEQREAPVIPQRGSLAP